ncbi:MAG: rhomboid family intramembrane serine protease [Bacteroidota bacterium]
MSIEYILQGPVALVIMLLTIGLSIWALFDENMKDRHVLIPYDMLMYKEYWRLISSAFIHGNYMHLAFNMLTFYFFAFMLESRLGHWQFAALYMGGLLISQIATTLIYRKDTAFEGSVGASGAISAMVLAAALADPYLRFGLPVISQQWPMLHLPGYIIGIVFLIYSLVNALRKQETTVNHHAHLWGAIAGVLMVFMLQPDLPKILERYIATL